MGSGEERETGAVLGRDEEGRVEGGSESERGEATTTPAGRAACSRVSPPECALAPWAALSPIEQERGKDRTCARGGASGGRERGQRGWKETHEP